MVEKTLVLIKPDGVCRGLIGEIIRRFEKEGFKISGLKMIYFTKEKAEEFYNIHQGKYFFPGLIKFMTTAPSVALIVEGENAIERVRKIMGERKPENAAPGTLRKEFASDGRRNIIHGSDSSLSARREIESLFKSGEIFSYEKGDWLESEPG
ncbi:nucleoside-diphosphate kinase [Candidatus Aerophobetes bacterium]|nr:nucleoside-diphosphate kinase [Candidatus Aerophobetes bacterium]